MLGCVGYGGRQDGTEEGVTGCHAEGGVQDAASIMWAFKVEIEHGWVHPWKRQMSETGKTCN